MWLDSYFKLIADQLEVVSPIFLVPHAFVRFNVMGLLAVVFLAGGACVLLWLFVLVLLFLLFFERLGHLGFLVLAQDLRCSSDEPLLELAPYADLVYSEAVVLLFIIVLRKEMELATEYPVVAFGAGASLRALTLWAPTSSIRIVSNDIASCT